MKLRHYAALAGALGGVLLCGGGLYATPYISLYQMYQAAEKRDVQALSQHIDFPALRESVKSNVRTMVEQESAKANNSIIGMLGSVLGGVATDPIVDGLVTPDGVAALLEGQKLSVGHSGLSLPAMSNQSKPEVTTQYRSWDLFAVSIKPTGMNTEPATLLLSRDGLSWKLSGVELPQSWMSSIEGLIPKSSSSDAAGLGTGTLKDVGRSAFQLFKQFKSIPLPEMDQESGDRSTGDQSSFDSPMPESPNSDGTRSQDSESGVSL
ncbi:MAG TPA: DUF2939 domain-containing protein [Stenomitos sp.]